MLISGCVLVLSWFLVLVWFRCGWEFWIAPRSDRELTRLRRAFDSACKRMARVTERAMQRCENVKTSRGTTWDFSLCKACDAPPVSSIWIADASAACLDWRSKSRNRWCREKLASSVSAETAGRVAGEAAGGARDSWACRHRSPKRHPCSVLKSRQTPRGCRELAFFSCAILFY